MAHAAPIEIFPFSPQWLSLFRSEQTVLASVFPLSSFRIEHIGSTAVPGLGAKPIVDVLIGAPSLRAVDDRIAATQALGYQYMPEHEVVLPQRRFFAKPVTRPRRFHVHAVAIDDPFFAEHLRFRDALRADPALAADYFALKVELAARFRDDRDGYTDAKTAFVRSVLDRAGLR
jgi:GrpB-like predicted nucleotidyltransferase (UPF0157 family)